VKLSQSILEQSQSNRNKGSIDETAYKSTPTVGDRNYDNSDSVEKGVNNNEITAASVAQTATAMTSAMGNKAYSAWSGLWTTVNKKLNEIPAIGSLLV